MKDIRWLNALLIIGAIVVCFIAITGDQLKELMVSNGSGDTKDFSIEAFETNQKESRGRMKESGDLVTISDEIVALGTAEDDFFTPEAFIGLTGEQIEKALYVVFKDQVMLYGSRLRYKDYQFYLDEEGICYGVASDKGHILGLELPISKSEFLEIAGGPLSKDKSSAYFKVDDLFVFIGLDEDYIQKVYASSTFEGALSITLNLEDHINNDMVKYLYYTPEEVQTYLGKPTEIVQGDRTIHRYNSEGIEIHYLNDDGNTVNVYRDGGFGVEVGSDEEFIETQYVSELDKQILEKGNQYTFKIGSYNIDILVEDKLVVDVELSK